MTIEQLAELSAAKLCALSDKELVEILTPYFNVTRPELAPKKQKKEQVPAAYLDPRKRELLNQLAEEGIDLSFMKKGKKR